MSRYRKDGQDLPVVYFQVKNAQSMKRKKLIFLMMPRDTEQNTKAITILKNAEDRHQLGCSVRLTHKMVNVMAAQAKNAELAQPAQPIKFIE